MYRLPLTGWMKHADYLLLDLLCLQFSFFLTWQVLLYRMTVSAWVLPHIDDRFYWDFALILGASDILVALLFNSFGSLPCPDTRQQFLANLRHTFLVFAVVTAWLYARKTGSDHPRSMIFLVSLFHGASSFGVMLLYKKLRWDRMNQTRSMIVVSTMEEVGRAIENVRRDAGVLLVGAVILDADMEGGEIDGVPILGGRGGFDQAVCREWVDEVYVRLPPGMEQAGDVFRSLREMGVTIHIDATAYRNLEGREFVAERIGESIVLTTSIRYVSLWELAAKRALDILGGIVGSIAAVLIIAAVAVPLKRQSPGPVLYQSVRVGRNGKKFTMYKIRSMYLDADRRKQELAAANRVSGGLMFKLDWDPRIIGNEELPDGTRKTGLGEFLRRTSLDEFPQFFNILRGEMSLVGTRPPTPDEWERYERHHRARLAVKPGLTGMWQVSGRSEITDFEEVVRLDMEYIRKWSLGLDLRILLKTVKVVLERRGAM